MNLLLKLKQKSDNCFATKHATVLTFEYEWKCKGVDTRKMVHSEFCAMTMQCSAQYHLSLGAIMNIKTDGILKKLLHNFQ